MTGFKPKINPPIVVVALLLALAPAAPAEDAFYQVTRGELKLTDGQWPQPEQEGRGSWGSMAPYAVLDHEGEVYCLTPTTAPPNRRHWAEASELVLLVRAPKDQEVRGRLFVPNAKRDGMATLSFTISPDAAKAEAQKRFHEAKFIHYEDLLARDVPGGAWWRNRAEEAARALGEEARRIREQLPRRPQRGLDDTFALFTGGRAVSENLQLDRALRLRPAAGEKSIDVHSIEGITVREFNWKPLIKDANPSLDPLASLIPADQHALFISRFDAAARLIDEGMLVGTEALNLAEPVTQDAMTVARYQKQLCLPLTTIGKLVGPRLVNGIAVTGSDPYFRTGTDVAVLFDATDAAALRNVLLAQIAGARESDSRAKSVTGTVAGVAYSGAITPDRSICAYVASLGDAVVVVTNSLKQLEQLTSAHERKVPVLASLPEYTFFRDRYRRGDAEESALMILSDAAIRRWCGPRWRIADSRRTRAAAALSALQAKHHDAIIEDATDPKLLSQDLIEGEDLRLAPHGVTSSTFGHLGFMTPVSELPVDRVSEAEHDAYDRWRDTYQQNWRAYFDPIALRIGTHADRLTMDLTVMPLIAQSDYQWLIDFTRGGKLAPGAADPHDTLAHVAVSVNRESEFLKSISVGSERWFRVNLLSWLGDSVSIYVDQSARWTELQEKAKENEGRLDIESEVAGLPIALRADSRDPLKLAAFLVGVRAFADQTAPVMIDWQSRQHKEIVYVRLAPTEQARRAHGENVRHFAVYYAALPDALTVTLNEEVIKRAIDRHLARSQAKPAVAGNARTEELQAHTPWLADHVALRVDRGFLAVPTIFGGNDYAVQIRLASWQNLPVLNEYKRLYPDRDPVEVHEQLWGLRLVCPVGGKYVWNEQYRTMESTAVGHPGAPRKVPALIPPSLMQFRSADFGLTFENAGLRARGVLRRETAEAK
jgi:hypothetical protein